MRFTFPLLTLPILALLTACASPAKKYATSHPNLSPAHRQILQRGEIPPGDAVAGMTRAQVMLAMNSDPVTYDRIGEEDVWVFLRKRGIGRESFDDMGRTSRMENTHSFTQTNDFSPRVDLDVKTSVFFAGDRATRATVTETEH